MSNYFANRSLTLRQGFGSSDNEVMQFRNAMLAPSGLDRDRFLRYLTHHAVGASPLIGSDFTEFHSGYRAYNVNALRSIPLDAMTHNWHFDTQIILEMLKKGFSIKEVPIPTYYGDEICYVNGVPYAMNCMWEALKFATMDRWRAQTHGNPLSFAPRPQE